MAEEKAVHNVSQSNGSGAINDEVIGGRPKILVDLAEIVFGVETPGAFACGGLINNIFPGLHIKGFGEVGLPFREREAKEILPLCQRAPDVSNVFELGPSNIEILNKDFVHQINSLVKDTVAVELGLGSNANIEARLYNVLLYEPGGFFVPHKDTEKEKGIFASLVVTLPSHFEGGDFIVKHQNTVKAFKPENPSYTTSYVAFFKDLKHESKQVTSGYRLTLVYNVVSLNNGPVPRPVGNERVINAKNCLQKWLKLNPGPSKFVYTLAHPFTPTGLSFNDLKNQDRGIVQVLQEAVKGEDFELYLGLLVYSKKGAPEDDEYDRYGNYEGTYNIDEVFEETISFRSLFTLDGTRMDKTLPLVVKDVYPADAFDDDDADSMSYEERKFPTIELRYRKAVVVLFPTRNWIDIMCEGEESNAVKYLASLVSKCLTIGAKDDAPEWLDCKRMAKILLEKNKHPRVNDSFLESLNAIGDVEMVQKYIEKVVTNFYGSEWKSFCTVIEQSLAKFGWEKLAVSVTKFIKGPMFDTKVKLLERFTTVRSEDPVAIETLKLLAYGLIKSDMSDNTLYVPTAEIIGQLARIANATDPALLTDIFTIIYSRFTNVDLQFIPTAKILYGQVPSIAQRPEFINLAQQCVVFLQSRIAIGQTRADNWTVLTPMSCNCNVCLVISNFMKDPNQVVYRYKAFSAERSHVEDSINKDLTKTFGILKLSTEGSGRATTLLIQKVKKESDIAKQTAAKDAATVTELISMVADNDADQDRALKRQKVDHTS